MSVEVHHESDDIPGAWPEHAYAFRHHLRRQIRERTVVRRGGIVVSDEYGWSEDGDVPPELVLAIRAPWDVARARFDPAEREPHSGYGEEEHEGEEQGPPHGAECSAGCERDA